jgi:hypothetical protein
MKSIICRQDGTRNPVVFLLDTLNKEAGTMKAWRDRKESKLETVSLDFYKATKTLSEVDESRLAAQFIEIFGADDGIILRRKMYSRTSSPSQKPETPEPVEKDGNGAQYFDKAKFVADFINAVQDVLIKLESEAHTSRPAFIDRRTHH